MQKLRITYEPATLFRRLVNSKIKMFIFLVALGFGSSMLFSMVPWEHYANCFSNGMVPDLSSKEKKCIELATPQAFGATPFFANDRFTQNGVEWCEENYQLYTFIKEDFFEHHHHSIESRVCASLYEDPLWTYYEPDRYQKLIERSAYYVELEISESKQEAQSGIIDVTPAGDPDDDTIFAGIIQQISINKPWEGLRIFDWSPDGNSILFRYAEQISHDNWKEGLATMNPDGTSITILPIPTLTEENSFHIAKFSPDENYIHILMQNGNLFRFNLNTEETISLTSIGGINYFDYYHFMDEDPDRYSIVVSVENEKNPLDSYVDYRLLDIGSGEQENSLKNAEFLIPNFDWITFDISPDGKKILYKKTIQDAPPRSDRVLAYLTADGNEVLISNADADCGSQPQWSPAGTMIVYHVSACSKGPSGGTIHLTTLDGSYHEEIVPYSHTNPKHFAISPDGTKIIYAANDNYQHDFEITTLAKPIPEFKTLAMMILIASIVPIVLISKSRFGILK